jgi:hypothetical protein
VSGWPMSWDYQLKENRTQGRSFFCPAHVRHERALAARSSRESIERDAGE